MFSALPNAGIDSPASSSMQRTSSHSEQGGPGLVWQAGLWRSKTGAGACESAKEANR